MKTANELIHDTAVQFTKSGKLEEVQKLEGILRAVINEGITPKQAMKMDQKAIDALYNSAYLQYNSGHYKNSLLLFIFLTSLDPKNVKYRLGMAASLHQDKQYRDAIEVYLACVPLDPFDPIPLYHASDCFMKLKEPFRAVYFLQTAVAQAKKNPAKYEGLISRANFEIKSIAREIKKITKLKALDEDTVYPILEIVKECMEANDKERKKQIQKFAGSKARS